MPKIIAIEGIDGAGKGTQANRLRDHLVKNGYDVNLFSFPQYEENLFGKEVGSYLNGDFGSLQEVHPKLSALLYACDRFEFFSKHKIKEDEIWIFDRYVYSNVAHQCTRADDPRSLRQWIENIEFEIFGLPKPDLVLFMDTDPEIAQGMVGIKHSRDYTDKQFDLHEADLAYLASVQKIFMKLSDELNWQKIPCVSENGMRSIDDIFQDIITAVRQNVLRDVE